MGSMGLLARACSHGGMWLNGGRRVTASLVLAAGAQVLATPALAQTQTCTPNPPAYGNQTLDGSTTMDVDDGQVACDTKINATGLQNVLSGGQAIVTTLSGTNAEQWIFTGGTAEHTTISSGGSQMIYGGKAEHTIIDSGGHQKVSAGTATSTTILGDGNHLGPNLGYQAVSSGGKAVATEIYGGGQAIDRGGNAEATRIHSGGVQSVYSGGSATSTTIYSGGTQDVSKGGTAIQTFVRGGVVSNTTTPLSATQSVYSGGEAKNTVIGAYGVQSVYEGDWRQGACWRKSLQPLCQRLNHLYSVGRLSDCWLRR